MITACVLMIARISLGHSGRPLTPHWIMKYAFALIILAGSIRLISAHTQPYFSFNLNVLSAVLWALAFGIYVVIYAAILTRPRPDGKPG